jgi:ADP-heptose:LPS heptosyltransferase
MNRPVNILVIRGGAVGDFILTLPAIAALRRLQTAIPGPRLEILGYPRIASLAVAAGLAGMVRSIEAPALAPFFTRDAPLPADQARYFDRFDLIVSYIHDPDRIFAQRVASVSKARYLSGPHRPDETARIHATEVFLRPLAELGIRDADPEPKLAFSQPSPYAADYADAHWTAVHPGSGSERKNWPEANWAGFLDELLATTAMNVLLVGGEAEGDRLTRLASKLPSSRVRLAQNFPLVELAQRLRCCARFFGHDSGITHLAAALGLPVVALWGETIPEIWRPLSPKTILLHHPGGLSCLPISAVTNCQAAISQ